MKWCSYLIHTGSVEGPLKDHHKWQNKWLESLAGPSLSCRRQVWCHSLRLGGTSHPKQAQLGLWDPWGSARAGWGSEPTGGSAFAPFVFFPLTDLGLWKVFCISESSPCLVGKGKSHKLELASVAAPSCWTAYFCLCLTAFFYPISFCSTWSVNIGFLLIALYSLLTSILPHW